MNQRVELKGLSPEQIDQLLPEGDKVKSEAERLFQLAQEAYVRSTLPPERDHTAAERLCVGMICDYHMPRTRLS